MDNPDVTQKERREILANDQMVRKDRDRVSTYHAAAQASIDDLAGGRFAKVITTVVTGSTPAVRYPAQPQTSPANQMALTGDEPSLGIDVNAMSPTGEKHEVEASEKASISRPGWRRI